MSCAFLFIYTDCLFTARLNLQIVNSLIINMRYRKSWAKSSGMAGGFFV